MHEASMAAATFAICAFLMLSSCLSATVACVGSRRFIVRRTVALCHAGCRRCFGTNAARCPTFSQPCRCVRNKTVTRLPRRAAAGASSSEATSDRVKRRLISPAPGSCADVEDGGGSWISKASRGRVADEPTRKTTAAGRSAVKESSDRASSSVSSLSTALVSRRSPGGRGRRLPTCSVHFSVCAVCALRSSNRAGRRPRRKSSAFRTSHTSAD